MQYKGKYKIFDTSGISTYPLSKRTNKVTLKDLISCEEVDKITKTGDFTDKIRNDIETISQAIVAVREADRSVHSNIVFYGIAFNRRT